jgi:hypothetical protein
MGAIQTRAQILRTLEAEMGPVDRRSRELGNPFHRSGLTHADGTPRRWDPTIDSLRPGDVEMLAAKKSEAMLARLEKAVNAKLRREGAVAKRMRKRERQLRSK